MCAAHCRGTGAVLVSAQAITQHRDSYADQQPRNPTLGSLEAQRLHRTEGRLMDIAHRVPAQQAPLVSSVLCERGR